MSIVKNDVANLLISAKDAADKIGYSHDYITRLAREGKVLARRSGRVWLVDLESVKLFTLEAEAEKRRRQQQLREERRREQIAASYSQPDELLTSRQPALRRTAMLQTTAASMMLFILLALSVVAREVKLNPTDVAQGLQENFQQAGVWNAFTALTESWWWFVREEQYVVAENTVSESEIFNTGIVTANEVRQMPQVDAATGEVLFAANDNGRPLEAQAVAGVFSDNVAVTFADSRRGTITPEFRSDLREQYPFRVIANPEKPPGSSG